CAAVARLDGAISGPTRQHRFPGPVGRHCALRCDPLRGGLAYGDGGRLIFFPAVGAADEHPWAEVNEPELAFGPHGRLWGAGGDAVGVWDGTGKERARRSDPLTGTISVPAGID